jgi:hypothetical protein
VLAELDRLHRRVVGSAGQNDTGCGRSGRQRTPRPR